jgi:UDP-N-acetylmuramate dehydrogenase
MIKSLHKALSQITTEIYNNTYLYPYTTFNIGGPADFIVIAKSTHQVIDTVKLCKTEAIPFKLLGGGSNVLISDKGFQGIIIINKANHWQIQTNTVKPRSDKTITARARLTSIGNDFYTTEGLDYRDPEDKAVLVTTAAGTRIIPFIKALFQKNITGLQWFSGIPASVGGAIYMNMHGGEYFFGDFVESALLFDGEKIKKAGHDYFNFAYEWCCLHKTGEIILEADLRLFYGDVDKARELSMAWARRKSLQPQKSVGCIFRNLSSEEQNRLEMPTSSIGYVIDKVLQLKGTRKGDAVISNNHAAFIENAGQAKASDVYYLYQLIKTKAKEQLDLELIPEIEFIGDF